MYKYTIISGPMKEVIDIHWLDEIDSTNDEASRRIGESGNLSVLAAERQTAGRGQRGNSWLSPAGENLTFSMVLKFGDGFFAPYEAGKQFDISVSVALGLVDYLENKGIEGSIKWPNDIYVRNRKICGVLIENVLSGEHLAHSVIGIGLNVNQKNFSPQLINPVSMTSLTNLEYDLKKELPLLCGHLRARLLKLGSTVQFNEYASKLFRFGQLNDYVICSTGKVIKAKIIGVKRSGLLRLETEKGEHMEFAFKEISFII